MNNSVYIASDLNTKIRILEEEKACLITSVRLVNEDKRQLIMEANRLRNDYERILSPDVINQVVHSGNTQNKTPIQDEQPNKIIELVELDKSSQESNDMNNNSHSTTGLNTKDGNASPVINRGDRVWSTRHI